jgi:hypothetical protein
VRSFLSPLVVSLSLFCAVAWAGPKVSASATVGGQKLVLNGTGMREATVFKVDVYKAALYLPKKERNAATILGTDQAWQLDMHFVRDVTKKQLTDAFDDGFRKNAKALGPVKGKLAKLNGYMGDVGEGDLIRLRYAPGKGTTVMVKGKTKPAIAGADFAAALLSVWLGNAPPNAGLKRGMLGG